MRNKIGIKLIIIVSILFITILCALLLGGASLKIEEVFKGILGIADNNINIIMQNIRIPRVVAGIISGIGLSVSGVLIQTVTGNDLASPNIIGINSGAGFMTILMLCFFPSLFHTLPLFAFLGALFTTIIIILLSKKIGTSKVNIILIGIAITTLLNAGISFISLLDTDVISTYNYFSIGGLSGVSFEQLIVPSILIVIASIVSILISHKLEVLTLGDDVAGSLGINVKALRIGALILASILAASVVSFAGLLGFVGLIVPHITRKIVGNKPKLVICFSMLIGSILVVLADLFGRVIFAPTEIPVGIVMSVIGAPFFLILLLRGNRHA